MDDCVEPVDPLIAAVAYCGCPPDVVMAGRDDEAFVRSAVVTFGADVGTEFREGEIEPKRKPYPEPVTLPTPSPAEPVPA